MQKSLKKNVKNGARQGLKEVKEKVSKVFHEAVQVSHEVCIDNDDKGNTTKITYQL